MYIQCAAARERSVSCIARTCQGTNNHHYQRDALTGFGMVLGTRHLSNRRKKVTSCYGKRKEPCPRGKYKASTNETTYACNSSIVTFGLWSFWAGCYIHFRQVPGDQ